MTKAMKVKRRKAIEQLGKDLKGLEDRVALLEQRLEVRVALLEQRLDNAQEDTNPVRPGWKLPDLPEGFEDATPAAVRMPDGWRLYMVGGPDLIPVCWPFKFGYTPRDEDFVALGFDVGNM